MEDTEELIEKPNFKFYHASVCYHVTCGKPISRPTTKEEDSCNIFWSIEKDLLKDEFQTSKPFYTRSITREAHEVTILFPDNVGFISEGRPYKLISKNNKSIKAAAYLHCTHFTISGDSIWHLVLSPLAGSYFTEYDLIKLTSLYRGLQERTKEYMERQVKFSISNKSAESVKNIIEIIAETKLPFATTIKSGTVQVSIDGNDNLSTIWDNLFLLINKISSNNGDANASAELNYYFYNDPNYEMCIKTCCGIILGIFNFDRYSYTEAEETLKAITSDVSYIAKIMNKTLTIFFSDRGKEFDSFFKMIGITPYMIIPHAVIIHNLVQINRAILSLEKIITAKTTFKKLEHERELAEKYLKINVLPLVFRYKTESKIYIHGFRNIGGQEKLSIANALLSGITKKIESVKRKSERAFMWGVGFANAFFAGFGFHAVADQFFQEVIPAENKWEWISFFIFLFISLSTLSILLIKGRKPEG